MNLTATELRELLTNGFSRHIDDFLVARLDADKAPATDQVVLIVDCTLWTHDVHVDKTLLSMPLSTATEIHRQLGQVISDVRGRR